MFIYHYFTSLIFALLALAYLIDKTNKKSLFALFAFFAILFFFFFSAFTYGFPLTPQEQNLLFWGGGATNVAIERSQRQPITCRAVTMNGQSPTGLQSYAIFTVPPFGEGWPVSAA